MDLMMSAGLLLMRSMSVMAVAGTSADIAVQTIFMRTGYSRRMKS
jgi:hypothetical protein